MKATVEQAWDRTRLVLTLDDIPPGMSADQLADIAWSVVQTHRDTLITPEDQ
jgi:hypothetical protein